MKKAPRAGCKVRHGAVSQVRQLLIVRCEARSHGFPASCRYYNHGRKGDSLCNQSVQ